MTLDEYIHTYGGKDQYQVINIGPDAAEWPSLIIHAGDKAAVVQFTNVADAADQHLCIDVHPFVGGRTARASVFGMEKGRRLEAFDAHAVDGTSQGWPAAALVAVLVGKQTETPSPLHVLWVDRRGGDGYIAAGGWRLQWPQNGQSWILDGPERHDLGQHTWSWDAQNAATEHIKAYRRRQRAAERGVPGDAAGRDRHGIDAVITYSESGPPNPQTIRDEGGRLRVWDSSSNRYGWAELNVAWEPTPSERPAE